MSEVKRYGAAFSSVNESDYGNYVLFDDFDRVTAERDAALETLKASRDVGVSDQQTIHNLVSERDTLKQRLTAADEELDQCQSMAQMIEEKEWAEHVGTGPISSQVESALTQLHNELSEARQELNQRDEQIATLDLQREAHLRNSQVVERRVAVLERLLRKVVKRTRWHGDPLKDEVDAALNSAEEGGDDETI